MSDLKNGQRAATIAVLVENEAGVLRVGSNKTGGLRANIGFAEIQSPTRIRLRVWERAAGLTLACGSGACATIVNAARRGLTGRRATIEADGGLLDMEWREDGHVLMTGPVTTSFHGTINLAAYPA